jgi:hypothetical protein
MQHTKFETVFKISTDYYLSGDSEDFFIFLAAPYYIDFSFKAKNEGSFLCCHDN